MFYVGVFRQDKYELACLSVGGVLSEHFDLIWLDLGAVVQVLQVVYNSMDISVLACSFHTLLAPDS